MIIDDEPDSVRELSDHLSRFDCLELLASVTDPGKAVHSILKVNPDVVFLDINMPGINGFEIVEVLHQTPLKPYIIFVTAFDKYAIQAIRTTAFDFLLKPINADELKNAIERLSGIQSKDSVENSYNYLTSISKKKKIKFNTTGGFILIDPDDILFIKADWNYSEIHYDQDTFELVSLNLGTVEGMLPEGNFARINRSVIVNLRYLDKVQRAKRVCVLKKGGKIYSFSIPVIRIRFLEDLL